MRFAAFMTIAAAILTGCKSKPAPQPEQSGISRPPAAESSPIDAVAAGSPASIGSDYFYRCNRSRRASISSTTAAHLAPSICLRPWAAASASSTTTTMAGPTFSSSTRWTGPATQTRKSYPALYHNNRDGTFTDVTRQAGLDVEMYGMGCAVGDFDNDGFDDIYVTAIGGSHLFRNLHNGKFADVTAKAGLADSGFPTGAVWFDYDNDGQTRSVRRALCRLVAEDRSVLFARRQAQVILHPRSLQRRKRTALSQPWQREI